MHDLALAMPHVTVDPGTADNPVYQVGGKSFVFFRNPRPDAVDPDTGERYADVIVFWVATEGDKLAMVQDEASPFFTTPHFDGHLSVLLRGSRIGEISRDELAEVVQDAWLSRASARRSAAWLKDQQSRLFQPGPGASWEKAPRGRTGMKANVGDQLLVESNSAQQHRRDGEIIEVRGDDGAPPYVVRWADGHEGLCFPGPDAHVRPRDAADRDS